MDCGIILICASELNQTIRFCCAAMTSTGMAEACISAKNLEFLFNVTRRVEIRAAIRRSALASSGTIGATVPRPAF